LSSGGSGTPGVWQNVTDPTRMNMDPQSNPDGNYGAISIMLDPVRPSDLYATICYQGLWKSTDYGVTWDKISTGINGNMLDLGRASMVIDPNPNRDPNTPPRFFTNSLYGGIAQGLWKSTNGGKDWTYIWNVVKAADGVTDIKQAVGSDVSVPVVDPSDGQHLILSMHGSVGYGDHIFESVDGGATWIDKGPTGMSFLSVFLIDRTTWLVQGDYFSSGNTLKTSNSGASWEVSGPMGHAHGGASLLNLGNGELYLGGIGVNQGIFHSLNSGDSWVRVPNSTDTSAMVATASRIYTSYGWAYFKDPISPVLGHVDRTGNTWIADPDPEGMTNGAVNLVVTNDGTHNIIVGAFYNAGIWRYVEP
jgi:hypothetical protein